MRMTTKPIVCQSKPTSWLMLISAGFMVIAVPGAQGQAPQKMQLGAPPTETAPGPAPAYEVSSVKPNKSSPCNSFFEIHLAWKTVGFWERQTG